MNRPASTSLRDLPSVDKLLQTDAMVDLISNYGRTLVVESIREVLNQARENYAVEKRLRTESEIIQDVIACLEDKTQPTLVPVINASGVILHTNLGRAPLSRAAMQAAQDCALGYSNLEYDLEKGTRGSRLIHAEATLRRLTGAEAALVVNNNAAGVMLVLSALARRRGVVIARSQLVEIGGGFRVPDVMKQSGARLVEVGTTNRVHLADYEAALDENPVLFLRAHRSNFRLLGFTSEPTLAEIANLAHAAGIHVVDDLGSGSLLDTARFGMEHEPTVQDSLQAGVDLVCFSGDKLLGGPQAGLIVGRSDLIAKLRKHPLARAIRADKLALSALSATLYHYLKGEAEKEVPIWRMIAASSQEIAERANRWSDWLKVRGVDAETTQAVSTVGGGSLPGETLPTTLLVIPLENEQNFLHALRTQKPPIIARIIENQVVFDPRTVLPEQESTLLNSIQNCYMVVNKSHNSFEVKDKNETRS